MSENKFNMTKKDFDKRNRRSFLMTGLAALAGIFGIDQIINAQPEAGLSSPLRAVLKMNEKLWAGLNNPNRKNSATESPANGTPARINGDIDLEEPVDLANWNLEYESPTLTKTFSLNDLAKFPRVSSSAEFRCVEGWSMPLGYEGISFSEFLKAIDPESLKLPYVGLETPDAGYYVGLDMASMLHPQTVLADRMNGAPLGAEHGEPFRLMIPIKYGIKNLKRVGKIFIASERPRDYWAENGYDWFSGH